MKRTLHPLYMMAAAAALLVISPDPYAASPRTPGNCDAERAEIGLEDTAQAAIQARKNMRMTRGMPEKAASFLSRSEKHGAPRRLRERSEQLPGTGLLIYGRMAEALCVWLITPKNIYAASPLPTITEIQSRINSLRNSLGVTVGQLSRAPTPRGLARKTPPPPANVPREQEAVRLLAEALLPAGIRKGLSEVRHLIVFPVLDIGTVPFGLLPLVDGATPLIEAMSVSISPGLVDYVESQQHVWTGIGRSERFLIVGNPDLTADEKWSFPNLPGAEREAKRLGELFGTSPLIGRAATAAAVTKLLPDADYLFLASHAIADRKSPLDRSFIALTASALTPREIQHKRVKPNLLVVLSACQTGLGQEHDIGILGLARAFQLAGSFATVMSLWNVDDDATYSLITTFAEELRRSAPQEALRLAMLQARKLHSAPAKWGSFVYFGHPVAPSDASPPPAR